MTKQNEMAVVEQFVQRMIDLALLAERAHADATIKKLEARIAVCEAWQAEKSKLADLPDDPLPPFTQLLLDARGKPLPQDES